MLIVNCTFNSSKNRQTCVSHAHKSDKEGHMLRPQIKTALWKKTLLEKLYKPTQTEQGTRQYIPHDTFFWLVTRFSFSVLSPLWGRAIQRDVNVHFVSEDITDN